LNYLESDENPIPGINYYRLRQTDFDGKHSYSEIKSVNYISNKKAISMIERICPNPFIDHLKISFNSGTKSEVKIKILDFSSRLIVSKNIQLKPEENDFDFDLEDRLPAGIYFIHVIQQEKDEVYKLVKL